MVAVMRLSVCSRRGIERHPTHPHVPPITPKCPYDTPDAPCITTHFPNSLFLIFYNTPMCSPLSLSQAYVTPHCLVLLRHAPSTTPSCTHNILLTHSLILSCTSHMASSFCPIYSASVPNTLLHPIKIFLLHKTPHFSS